MSIFSNLNGKCLEVFMDDFTLYGDDFEDWLMNLMLVLERYEATHFVFNWEKCHFMVKEGIVLGHKVWATKFYRRFIKNFSSTTKLLTALLVKDDKFIFNMECLRAFESIKEKLVSAHNMVTPDWSQPFEIMCDAVVVGVVLGQRKEKIFRPIYYASRTLNDAQVNYATTEKELFAVVFAFDKFRSYLVGSKIFSIAAVSERLYWYADVANLLASGWLSRDFSRDQRREFQSEERWQGFLVIAMTEQLEDIMVETALQQRSWKSVEAIPTRTNDARVVCEFLRKNIFTLFGTPRVIISDHGSHFVNKQFDALLSKYGVTQKVGTPYHAQTSGHVEVANRELKRIVEKMVSASRTDWFAKLDEALWAYRTAFKTTIWTSPFKLVYEKSCHLPAKIEHKAYWAIKMLNPDLSLVGKQRLS
ncbi:uncharacterized protein LOC142166454 [Nicotiana tabacum]|uniref:Uncharacterized protein LOC142166454 n=1 Tax=Nicotiana tabacum TaxID=4097 RepID=A0AC58SAC5_TOBAC